MLGAGSQHVGGHQAFGERRRMRVEPLGGSDAENVVLAIEKNGSRRIVARNGVDENQRAQPDDLMREIESRRAEIDQLNILAELESRFELAQNERANAVIPEQDIPYAADERSSHRIFATAILRPEGSKA